MRYNSDQILGQPIENKRAIPHTNPTIEIREYLKITLKNSTPGIVKNKTMTVIMMNPASADSIESDATVNRVIDYTFNQPLEVSNESDFDGSNRKINDIHLLNIVNLFSLYHPNSNQLQMKIEQVIAQLNSNYLQAINQSNLNTINGLLSNTDYIALGWGMPKPFHLVMYFEQIAKVLDLIIPLQDQTEVFTFIINDAKLNRTLKLNDYGVPPHPINGDIEKLTRVDIDNLRRIIPR